jgi:hypothetical protein
MRALRSQTCAQHHTSIICGQPLGRSRHKLLQTLISTMGRSYGGRRSRVCIDANARTELHIQHRWPNGWADRGPHWYKHLLGQWAVVMGVGDRKHAHITTYPALAPESLDRLNPKLVQKFIGEWAQVMGVCVRVARAACAPPAIGVVQPSHASAERKNERKAREYRDGTGRRNRSMST